MLAVQEALAMAARLVDQEDLAQAETLARQVLECSPKNVGALHILGVIARKSNRPGQAVEYLTRAIDAGGKLAAIYFELGIAQKQNARPDEAAGAFLQAIELDSNLQSAYVNLAAVLEYQQRFDEALPISQWAARLEPGCALTRFNLANLLWAMNRAQEACQEFETAVCLDPTFAKAHWNSACCHLYAGQFEEGWRQYEWREAAEEVPLDKYMQPRWTGEPLAGKRILVHAEQGIGDEILFATCWPELIAQAGQCVFVCDPRLAPLFARSFPAAIVHGQARRKDLSPAQAPEKIDYQIPAGSVPQFFRPSRESFPRRQRFLVADPAQRRLWQQRFAALGPGLKIGMSWQAGGQPAERMKRTTALGQWQSVLHTPGVHWINLQYGETAEDLAQCRREQRIVIHDWPEANPLVDMDGFAAKVAALDLVISVGNATVHVAGALGVPAWNLLPHVPAWRWMASTEQSLWYPSVRLFRQPLRGDWSSVFDRVAGMLAEETAKRGLVRAPGDMELQSAIPTSPTMSPPSALPALPPSFTRLAEVDEILEQAAQNFRDGDLAQAESRSREVLAHAPRNVNALRLLGTIARQTGRLDLAVRSLSQAAIIWDQDAVLQLDLGAAQQDSQQLAEAIASFRRAIALKPELVEAHMRLGGALLAARQGAEAIESFETATRLQSDVAKNWNALGCALLNERHWPAAEIVFRRALKLQADYMAAHNNLGQVLQNLQRHDEAIACYQRALEIDPDCRQALVNLARAFHAEGQPETATRLYRRALVLRPDDPHALSGLARLGKQQGKSAASVADGSTQALRNR